ncbi:MAG: GH36-type glycosyl hydrolase domain-containing protein [Candidatus Omnitrophota bacterium]
MKKKKQKKAVRVAFSTETRKFKSRYGYFTADGSEYVITDPRTPRPWINVNCNEHYGYVVSQTGGGFSWFGNAQLSRLTTWYQDLIRDDYGRFVYVRDQTTGKIWSTTWKPTCFDPQHYEVRYGLGYTVFKTTCQEIETEQRMFVPRRDSCEIWQTTVRNRSKKKRQISLIPFLEWCLGNGTETHREFQKTFIEVKIDRKLGGVIGYKRPALVPSFISTGLKDFPLRGFLAATNVKPSGYDGDKETFLGMYGSYREPQAVAAGKVAGRRELEKWGDAIAALQVDLTLAPGEERTVIFLLGRIAEEKEAGILAAKYATVAAVEKAFAEVQEFWQRLTDASWIETPDEAMNFLTNKWYRYQALSGRMWAKTAYYQCSGGIGFRDQLQDSNCMLECDPSITRRQILVHAEQMFPDGTVYHWWHPGTGMGAHTEMSDDLLWLTFLLLNYIDETGDHTILDEVTPYVTKPGEPKLSGTIYDHACRSFEKVLSRWSPRGLPLIGEGDWNDGMSHVGPKWKGESVWLGHFFYGLLLRFAEICRFKKEGERADRYLDRAKRLKKAINEHMWDGEWYIRATRDNGIPLGSKSERRGKIFLNAQTWAVICGTATPERARIAMDSAYRHLYREYGPLLFTPGYDQLDETIGYLSRYAPSVRENGGVYTHAACWGVQAAAMMRDGERAYEAYRAMCPAYRGLDPDHYCAEPYVTPGNVDGPDSPNFGRGGWTWYSGSGAWMQKVAYNWICGVRASAKGLVIDPVIPAAWKGFRVKRTFRGTVYMIEVENPKGASGGVRALFVDGEKIQGNVVPLLSPSKVHHVKAVLG